MKRKLLSALFLALAASLCLCAPALALDAGRDSGLLMLVNKTHTIPADYVPQLKSLSGSVPVTSSSVSMRPEAADACAAMFRAMEADGVALCLGQSGYRSYETQNYLLSSRINARTRRGMSWQAAYDDTTVLTAPPGASEHQTGLAMDFGDGGALTQRFAKTAAGQWMAEHAWEYGFILRYRADKAEQTMIGAEAWHYRYVGVPHAKLMRERDWCLEEYIDYLHAVGFLSTQIGGVCYDVYWTGDAGRDFSGENIVDLSRDNAGGWIVTASHAPDPLRHIRGHWSEEHFLTLEARGVPFETEILPDAAVTGRELAVLCGLQGGGDEPLTREGAALLLAPALPDQKLARLAYADLSDFDGAAFQPVQTAVSNGLFSHTEGKPFHPKAALTWGEAAVLAVKFRALAVLPPASAEVSP